jgi:hypothetical protein
MKKNLLLIGFIIYGLTAQSQVLISILLGDKLNSEDLDFGLEGGINLTNINGFENTKALANFNLGFYFDIRMKNQLFLYTGVQVKSNFGMRNLSETDLEFLDAQTYPVEGEYKQKISAFMVPVLAKYNFKNHIYIEAGPQLGLVYKGWVEFTSDVENVESLIKDYNDELLNWFNGGVAIGTGYRLMKGEGWTVGVRYYQGLTNVFKGRSGSIHNSLHFKVNIPIGAGKAKEK